MIQANQGSRSTISGQFSPLYWSSIFQFGFGILGMLVFWGLSITFGIIGLIQYFSPSISADEAMPFLFMSAGTAFVAVILIPSTGFALMRLLGRPFEKAYAITTSLRPVMLILAFPIIVLLGFGVSQVKALAWLFLPPLHVFAVAIPIVWLGFLALRGLSLGSRQRTWGMISLGVVVSPPLIFFLELLLLLLLFIVVAIWLSTQPNLADELAALAERLQLSSPTPEAIIELLGPYLTRPVVIYTIFAFVAVAVPLIEELLKPIAAWLLIGRYASPAQGFAAGVISGAGFALVESLALSSNAEDWALLVMARLGTSIIHILTAALMGWAFISAWHGGRYLRLGITYLLTVVVHGTWNTLTLLTVSTNMSQLYPDQFDFGILASLGEFAPYILVALTILGFVILILLNRYFQLRQEDQKEIELHVV